LFVADLDPRRELARRLRSLREVHWPGRRVNQAQLAAALGADGRRSVSVPLISSWESYTNPKVPPPDRIRDIATFYASPRSFDGHVGRLLSPDEMTVPERAAREQLLDELTRLRHEALGALDARAPVIYPGAQEIARSLGAGLYRFEPARAITIVCAQSPTTMSAERSYALAERSYTDSDPSEPDHSEVDPLDPDFAELSRFSDLDSLLELFGHLRAANPTSPVRFRAAGELIPDDYVGHLISLGSVDWNGVTRALFERLELPVWQASDRSKEGGAYFEATEEGGRKVTHRPWLEVADGRQILREDVALFARAVNPFNRRCTVTICNGIYGKGTYGAVRALTDERFRDRNMEYIRQRFANSEVFCILTRVPVERGFTLTPDWTVPETVLFGWSRSQS
jgi:hypothetical protein